MLCYAPKLFEKDLETAQKLVKLYWVVDLNKRFREATTDTERVTATLLSSASFKFLWDPLSVWEYTLTLSEQALEGFGHVVATMRPFLFEEFLKMSRNAVRIFETEPHNLTSAGGDMWDGFAKDLVDFRVTLESAPVIDPEVLATKKKMMPSGITNTELN